MEKMETTEKLGLNSEAGQPSRRGFLCGAPPAVLGLAGLLAGLAGATAEAETGKPLDSFTSLFAEMKARDTGPTVYRGVCEGRTDSGAWVEVHETELRPGQEPHPPHRHKHEEFLLLMRGQMEVTVDGVTSHLTPGSVGYWKSMALHHSRNTGTEMAQYFIVGLGRDA